MQLRRARWAIAPLLFASGCALVAGLKEVSVDEPPSEGGAPDSADPDQMLPPEGDGGVLPVPFDAMPVDAPLDVSFDAPVDAPYVASWSTDPWGDCSDTLCGGTQCRAVYPATFKSTPPDAPPPATCQTCTPRCCDCIDLGTNWFDNNQNSMFVCEARCSGGCIVKNRGAITLQQSLGCVLRESSCIQGCGC